VPGDDEPLPELLLRRRQLHRLLLGYCGADGFCGAARCGDQGCECTTGTENPCNNGLVCCPNTSGVAGGPGTCVAASACDAGDDSADTGDAAGTIDDGGSADDGGTDASGSADAGGSADAATATDADDGAIDAGGSADDPAGETGIPAAGVTRPTPAMTARATREMPATPAVAAPTTRARLTRRRSSNGSSAREREGAGAPSRSPGARLQRRLPLAFPPSAHDRSSIVITRSVNVPL
jgi:hypothetical protein